MVFWTFVDVVTGLVGVFAAGFLVGLVWESPLPSNIVWIPAVIGAVTSVWLIRRVTARYRPSSD